MYSHDLLRRSIKQLMRDSYADHAADLKDPMGAEGPETLLGLLLSCVDNARIEDLEELDTNLEGADEADVVDGSKPTPTARVAEDSSPAPSSPTQEPAGDAVVYDAEEAFWRHGDAVPQHPLARDVAVDWHLRGWRDALATLREQEPWAVATTPTWTPEQIETWKAAMERTKGQLIVPGSSPVQEVRDKFMEQAHADLLAALRDKRAVDGLNGRPWDATKHYEAEQQVERIEAEIRGVLLAAEREAGDA